MEKKVKLLRNYSPLCRSLEMKLTRIGSAGRTCGGHVWRGFSSTCTLAARPAAATDLVISSGLRRHSAASPADQPQAEAATTTTTTATTKPPARRRRATTRAATSSGDEQEEEEKAVSAPKNRRAADLGLGVVTRERCLLTVKRSAEWVLGLDVNTNSTGFTVLHAPTGTAVPRHDEDRHHHQRGTNTPDGVRSLWCVCVCGWEPQARSRSAV
jgi:hypothetical protein